LAAPYLKEERRKKETKMGKIPHDMYSIEQDIRRGGRTGAVGPQYLLRERNGKGGFSYVSQRTWPWAESGRGKKLSTLKKVVRSRRHEATELYFSLCAGKKGANHDSTG